MSPNCIQNPSGHQGRRGTVYPNRQRGIAPESESTLPYSLKEAEERMELKAKIQRLPMRLEATKKAAEELDKAHDNAGTLSTILNFSIEQANVHMKSSVVEIFSHLNPSKGEDGLDAKGALVHMEALCSCLQQAQERVREKGTKVKEARQAASAFLAGLEQVQEKAQQKMMTAEECQDSVQAFLVNLEYSEKNARRQADKLQEALEVVQEHCSGLEHVIQLTEATDIDVDSVMKQVSELKIALEKVAKETVARSRLAVQSQ